jgi:hypothetical protein
VREKRRKEIETGRKKERETTGEKKRVRDHSKVIVT